MFINPFVCNVIFLLLLSLLLLLLLLLFQPTTTTTPSPTMLSAAMGGSARLSQPDVRSPLYTNPEMREDARYD